MSIEEARLYLEHTSKEDFNLEEWQKENRYQAIQVVLKEIERLNKELENLEKLNNANYQSFIEVNNIINELEKYLIKIKETSTPQERIMAKFVLEYIKILKGEDKE